MIANIVNGIAIRLLAIVNILLLPYVFIRFPREAWDYTKGSFLCLWDGKVR